MFVGLTVAFFPMHLTGLLGMPRRVHTYAGTGLGRLNMISTVGAFVLAAGVLVVLVDLALHLRVAARSTPTCGARARSNGCRRTTTGRAAFRASRAASRSGTIPGSRGKSRPAGTTCRARHRRARNDRHQPGRGAAAIPAAPAGPSWLPLIAGAGTAAFFLLLTVKLPWLAAIGGLVALAAIWRWLWQTDRGPSHPPVDIGGGIKLPVYATGPSAIPGGRWWC